MINRVLDNDKQIEIKMSYDFSSIKVLIVEDNQPMLNLLRSVIQSFGVTQISTATDGKEGFIQFCQHNPDIVITDWMMHPTDGIEMGRKIRNEPQSPNQYVPIILMSGFSEKHRVLSARDAGITEFIVKPFNARDLYKRIQQIVERPRQYIRSENFFGPDRRRKKPEKYTGPFRRESDIEDQEKSAQDIKNIDLI